MDFYLPSTMVSTCFAWWCWNYTSIFKSFPANVSVALYLHSSATPVFLLGLYLWSFFFKGIVCQKLWKRVVHVAKLYIKKQKIPCQLHIQTTINQDGQLKELHFITFIKLEIIVHEAYINPKTKGITNTIYKIAIKCPKWNP